MTWKPFPIYDYEVLTWEWIFLVSPSSEQGEYFRANIWSWSPIYELTATLCGDLLDQQTIDAMAFNNGAGPEDGTVCATMANRLEVWLAANQDEEITCSAVDPKDECLSQLVGNAMANAFGVVPKYSTDRKHVQEWATFLATLRRFPGMVTTEPEPRTSSQNLNLTEWAFGSSVTWNTAFNAKSVGNAGGRSSATPVDCQGTTGFVLRGAMRSSNEC